MPPIDPESREIRWERLRASLAGASAPVSSASASSTRAQGARHALPDDLTGLVRAVLVVVVVAVAIAGVLFWRAWPREVDSQTSNAVGLGRPDAPSSMTPVTPSAGAGFGSTGGAPTIVVHVVGRVRRPGVVRLPPGARVADAVKAAGGLRAGTDPADVNLARPLTDGEQLIVAPAAAARSAPVPDGGETPNGTSGQAAGSGAALDLNRASADQLEQLDGIGPVLAGRIVEYREQQGRFASVDDLREVSGIGPKIFAALRTQVRV